MQFAVGVVHTASEQINQGFSAKDSSDIPADSIVKLLFQVVVVKKDCVFSERKVNELFKN